MDYCKFENTLQRLSKCLESLESREISSESEKEKARKMLTYFLEFCEIEGLVDEANFGNIDKLIDECN